MHDRSEWIRGTTGPQEVNGKNYKHLTRFSRPCAACGELFSIFVTDKIADGLADSNSFGLKNCEAHRRGGPRVDSEETIQLRTANATMSEELTGLYAQLREARDEIDMLRSTYELPAAMQTVAAELNGARLQPEQLKMPWEN